MRDSANDYILQGSFRTDGFSTGLAGLGSLPERVEGLEWMAPHLEEAVSDPRNRGRVKEILRSSDPNRAMADQATADAVEMAYPTGKPVLFRSFAASMVPRIRAAEAVAAQEMTNPDPEVLDLWENSTDPEGNVQRYMDLKVLQAMGGGFSDEQIHDLFYEESGLGKKKGGIFKKIKKVVKKVGKVVPKPIRKVVGNVLKVTPIGLVATVAKKQFIDAPKKARKQMKAASKEAAAAQADYDAAFAEAQAAMSTPTLTQAEVAAQYAAAQYAPPPQGYETPQPSWSSPAPSGGGGGGAAPAEEAAVAVAPPEEKSGGMAAAAVAIGAGVLIFLTKGKK